MHSMRCLFVLFLCACRVSSQALSVRGLSLASTTATFFLSALWTHSAVAQTTTAHIIPHSHCDPGWLESFEGYYQSQVNRILSSMVNAVKADPARRFVWAEASFFMRWYEAESEETRGDFRRLVASGQVEFVGGGWVQNDEANPDFAAVISQLTEGHEYIHQLFGKRPRIAWQIDPFGHSSATAAIAAAAGYEALVINRIDHTIKDALKSKAGMEFWWSPYSSLPLQGKEGGEKGGSSTTTTTTTTTPPSAPGTYAGEGAGIFTHVLHKHYSAPVGYDFENPEGYAVGSDPGGRAAGLVNEIRNRARAYRTSHMLVPFGDDFKFQNAEHQFQNMDALIKHINTGGAGGGPAFPGFRIQYSTLGEYFDAVFQELKVGNSSSSDGLSITTTSGGGGGGGDGLAGTTVPPPPPLPVYSPSSPLDGGVDFFPYADNANSYWVGYYVSRPSLKSAIRRTTALLRGVESLLALARPSAHSWAQAAGLEMVRAEAAGDKGRALGVAPFAAFSWLAAFQRLEQVRLDVALCLHHDAITGTSRDYVVDDYARRMKDGGEDALMLLSDLASLVLGGDALMVRGGGGGGGGGAGAGAGAGAATLPPLSPAPLTQAPHVIAVPPTRSSESVLGGGKSSGSGSKDVSGHPVVIFNPLAWDRVSVARVMVDVGSVGGGGEEGGCGGGVRWPVGLVRDSEGKVVAGGQWLAVVEDGSGGAKRAATGVATAAAASSSGGKEGVVDFPEAAAGGKSGGGVEDSWRGGGVRYELVWPVILPPLSLSTYFVSVAWGGRDGKETEKGEEDASSSSSCPPPLSKTSLAQLLTSPTSVLPTTTAIVVPSTTTTAFFSKGGEGGAGFAVPTTPTSTSSTLAPPPPLAVAIHSPTSPTPPTITLENACLILEVSPSTGLLTSVTRKLGGGSKGTSHPPSVVRVPVEQGYAAYSTRNSGAYLFRPLDEAGKLSNNGEVTISASTGQGGAVNVVRVVGSQWSHTISLSDTLGWGRGGGGGGLEEEEEGGGKEGVCSDPLHPDAGFDVIPTLSAAPNTEVVMTLEVGLEFGGGAGGGEKACEAGASCTSTSTTNLRDLIRMGESDPFKGAAAAAAAASAAGAGDATTTSACIPFGWWTSDGLGLLRRAPAPPGTPGTDHQKHFYPLNTLTRLSGAAAAASGGGGGGVAWLSLYTQQPMGVFAERRVGKEGGGGGGGGGVHWEVMIHRRLSQDDGRGLASGVEDSTVLTPHLRFTMGAQGKAAGSTAAAAAVSAEEGKVACGGGEGVASTTPTATTTTASDPAAPSTTTPTLHSDWTWKWAATSIGHVQPPVLLHADLVNLVNEGGKKGRKEEVEGGGHISPPFDPLSPPGSLSSTTATLSEPRGVPWSQWTSRFSTRWRGLSTALPPTLHLLTLQARGGVTDDTTLRLQNFGGDTVSLDIVAALSSPSTGVTVTGLSPRSLTLNAGEGGVSQSLSRFSQAAKASKWGAARASGTPTEGAFVGLATLVQSKEGSIRNALAELSSGPNPTGALLGVEPVSGGESGTKQNTEEEGVFISDAAVRAAAAKAKGRLLLLPPPPPPPSTSTTLRTTRHHHAIHPTSIRTFLLTLEPPDTALFTSPSLSAAAAAATAGVQGGGVKIASVKVGGKKQQQQQQDTAAPGGLSTSSSSSSSGHTHKGGKGSLLQGGSRSQLVASAFNPRGSLTSQQYIQAMHTLIESLTLPPLRQIRLREEAASPDGVPSIEAAWLFRLARRTLSQRTHDTGEELDMPDTLEEILVALVAPTGGKEGAGVRMAAKGGEGQDDDHLSAATSKRIREIFLESAAEGTGVVPVTLKHSSGSGGSSGNGGVGGGGGGATLSAAAGAAEAGGASHHIPPGYRLTPPKGFAGVGRPVDTEELVPPIPTPKVRSVFMGVITPGEEGGVVGGGVVPTYFQGEPTKKGMDSGSLARSFVIFGMLWMGGMCVYLFVGGGGVGGGRGGGKRGGGGGGGRVTGGGVAATSGGGVSSLLLSTTTPKRNILPMHKGETMEGGGVSALHPSSSAFPPLSQEPFKRRAGGATKDN